MAMLKNNDALKIKEIDRDVKNKFSLKWMEKTVIVNVGKTEITESISENFVKIDLPGQALCKLCSKQINYGKRGFVAIEDHAKSSKHKELLKNQFSSHRVDSMFKQHIDDDSTHTIPCSVPFEKEPKPLQLVPMCDRVSNAEATVLGVVAEHSIPLTYVPILVNMAKNLARDQKALSELHMDRTTASYKLNHGLAESFKQKLVRKLKCHPFSLNLDEATSKSNKKVLTILASFYDPESETVKIEHLMSSELVKTTASSIYDMICDVIESNSIPWCNLLSILMDSCNVMRGNKSGVETQIRQKKAPHLLNIDGDSCHHIHNSCKKLCKPFNLYLEKLFNDLYNDFKYSQDLVQSLKEICQVLDIRYITPERFVSHRWLSAYEITLSTLIMYEAYVVFYWAFLGKENKLIYNDCVLNILSERNISPEGKAKIKSIQETLGVKKLTDDGKKRKARIYEKILFTDKTTKLQLSFYQSALHLLKKYVCTFQYKDTLIHQIHEAQFDTAREFLACFMKAEEIASLGPKGLKSLNLESDNGQFLKQKEMYVGVEASKFVKSYVKGDNYIKVFLDQASTGYIECARHMLNTLPIDNKLLKALASIDPALQNHSKGVKLFKSLAEYFGHLLTEEEQCLVHSELNRYCMEREITSVDGDVVKWWASISKSKKYPSLTKIGLAALSIFHGPVVESTFNVMGDIISDKSTSTLIETYSAYQTVKYALKSRKVTALKYFERKDIRYSYVDRHTCIQMRLAAQRYKRKKQLKREMMKEKLRTLKVVNKENLISKKKTKEHMKQASAVNFDKHVATEEKKAKKRLMVERLSALVVKRRKICD